MSFLVKQLNKKGKFIPNQCLKKLFPITSFDSKPIVRGKQTSANSSDLQNNSLDTFMRYLPIVADECSTLINQESISDIGKYFRKCLEHMLKGGLMYRGMTTVEVFKALAPKNSLTDDNMRLANYLGWSHEVHNLSITIADDIVDGGVLRRGNPCWHLVEGVGMNAVVDALLVEQTCFAFLKKNFSHLECYPILLDLFHDFGFHSTLGQIVDCNLSKLNVTEFNMEGFRKMTDLKTSFAVGYCPVASGMALAGYKRPIIEKVKPLIFDLGCLYQIANDFDDCFGDVDVTKKVGMDIETNKCSWLAITALEKGTKEQREIMRKHYGKDEVESVQKIKQLYTNLKIPELYANFRTENLKKIKSQFEEISRTENVSSEIFDIFMKNFKGRI